MVQGAGTLAEAAVIELIRRVPNDHVEAHVLPFENAGRVHVRERIGVLFAAFTCSRRLPARTAVTAFASVPVVLRLREPDVPVFLVEPDD